MGLFSKKPERDLVLVIDVQSSVVRCMLASFARGKAPHILLIHTIPTPYKPHAGSAYLVKITVRAITEGIGDILRALHAGISSGRYADVKHKISAVHYVLSSPWIVSQAKTLSLDFPHETRLSKEKISQMIEEERTRIVPDDQGELTAIEEKVFDVRLNGYSVPNWEDMSAKSAGVSFVTSIASRRMIERFKDTVRHHVSAHRIYFHSSLLLQNVGIQKILPGSMAYTLIHIHGELTDVVVVDKHSCIFFGSYPLGIRGVIRKIAAAAKTDDHAAESSLTLHLSKQFDESHGKGIGGIIDETQKSWTEELAKLFESASFKGPLPPDTVISAHSHDGFFVKAFKDAYPSAKIRLLEIDEIAPHVLFEERIERSLVPALYAVALHTMAHE